MIAETAPGPRVLTGAFALAGAMALALGLAACPGPGKDTVDQSRPSPENRPRLLETVGEFAIAPLYADGFEELSPRERVLAFYLHRAALAGRDIYYDQMGKDGLEIRDLLEEILTHPRGIPRPFLDQMLLYLKLFWINSGNHNDRTQTKFVPAFTVDDLRSAAHMAARGGAAIRVALGETLDAKIDRLRASLFDPSFQPMLTCKAPPPGRDIVTGSSVNFYEGVTLAEAGRFAAKYPLNSRLVKRGGRVEEEVYRAGRGEVPAGRYSSELQTIIGFLGKGRPHAGEAQGAVLGELQEYFATGDPEAFRRYNIAWVAGDFPVDTINGFIETYKDPLARKGAWEGLVYFVDSRLTRLQKSLAAQAQYFEERAPWDGRYKRQGFPAPTASAINLLVATGDSGPMPPVGVNLPNDEALRQRHGSKSVSLVNVIAAGEGATRKGFLEEFVLPEERRLLEDHGSESALLMTTLHEVLGHAAGKVSDGLQGEPSEHLREYYGALEEARAELVALHDIFDPRLAEIGAVTSPDVPEAACREYVARDLYMLRRVRQGNRLEDDHMRAMHLIVSYLREETRAVERVRREDRTYQRITDLQAFRRGVATLLAEVQRIKGEGDRGAARSLSQRFATRIDPALRDEIVRRADLAGVPSYVAFLMPEVVPVRDGAGNVVDARLAYGQDFALQMLRFSGKLPLEPEGDSEASSSRLP